jgi:hypothetical protein
MGFSTKQVQALRRGVHSRHVRTREAHGRTLSYIEGWYAVSEANRIFGFDNWNRETIESRCVMARENRGSFLAVYAARVRVTVQAEGATIIREAHGTGEGRGTSPGDAHDIALKGAETDATKRALATFGRPFGLELYRNGRDAAGAASQARNGVGHDGKAENPSAITGGPQQFARDDTTPIPRPSRYYGRQQHVAMHEQAGSTIRRVDLPVTTGPAAKGQAAPVSAASEASAAAQRPSPLPQPQDGNGQGAPATPAAPTRAEPASARPTSSHPANPAAHSHAGHLETGNEAPLVPTEQAPTRSRIDKSVLTIGAAKRIRDKAHLRFVASQPCLICGRQPSDAHHLRFAQPRAIGMKVSDEFTVPLCRGHHRQLHQVGNEVTWWEDLEIDALEIAKGLWEQSRGRRVVEGSGSG